MQQAEMSKSVASLELGRWYYVIKATRDGIFHKGQQGSEFTRNKRGWGKLSYLKESKYGFQQACNLYKF